MLSTFEYYKPDKLGDALQCMATREGVALLAGGTDLMVLLRRNLIQPQLVLDLKSIAELQEFQFTKGKGLCLGAGVTVNRLAESELVQKLYPALAQAAATLASYPLRNRATVGGNLCNASPGADLPPSLLVYEAKVRLVSASGQRELALKDFFTGVKRTVIQKGELLQCILLPDPGEGDRSVYLKQSRLKGHDLATVGVAARRSGSGEIFLAAAAVAATPVRIVALEEGLKARGLSEESAIWAAEEVKTLVHPITDVRSSAEYRTHIVSVLVKRSLMALLQKEA